MFAVECYRPQCAVLVITAACSIYEHAAIDYCITI